MVIVPLKIQIWALGAPSRHSACRRRMSVISRRARWMQRKWRGRAPGRCTGPALPPGGPMRLPGEGPGSARALVGERVVQRAGFQRAPERPQRRDPVCTAGEAEFVGVVAGEVVDAARSP